LVPAEKIDCVLKEFPRLADEHKQLVLGTARKLAEVQRSVASSLGQNGLRYNTETSSVLLKGDTAR
jgi:hypothetical protein